MSRDDRFVFDTNVMVSALLFADSTPAQAFFGAKRLGTILLSGPSFLELHTVLWRSKFDRYLTAGEREAFLVTLLASASLVEVHQQIVACRDPNDDKFLEVALDGEAACLVTGDPDLLALHPFRGVPIITASEFAKLFLKPG